MRMRRKSKRAETADVINVDFNVLSPKKEKIQMALPSMTHMFIFTKTFLLLMIKNFVKQKVFIIRPHQL